MIDPHFKPSRRHSKSSRSKSSKSQDLFSRAILFSVAILLFVPTALPAQGVGEVNVQLINGKSFNGSIESIDQQGQIAGQGIPQGLNVADLLSIKTKRTVSKTASKVVVYPAGGGEIFANQLALSDESLTCQGTDGGEIQLPLQSIRAVVWASSSGVQSTVKSPLKDNDQIVVQVEDGERIVSGILESVDGEFLQVNYKNESRKIGLAKVMAFVIADLGLKKQSGVAATVELVDGSRLVGVVGELAGGDLEMKRAGGASLKIKAQKVVAVSIVSDRLAYLSDLSPVEVQEKSIFAIQLPWQRNRSVGNNPMRLTVNQSRETIEFNKGIGMQSFSQLSFANSNDFDRFKAVVGIDAETAGHGDCQMVVRGDGIELWSRRVKAADDPLQVDLDIAGIKEITLIVYPGEEFDLGDHADWGEARLLKTK